MDSVGQVIDKYRKQSLLQVRFRPWPASFVFYIWLCWSGVEEPWERDQCRSHTIQKLEISLAVSESQIDTLTEVCCQGEPSRLCKRSLADSFRRLCSYQSSHMALKASFSSGFLQHVTYEEVKAGARYHRYAKQTLTRALLTKGCGRYIFIMKRSLVYSCSLKDGSRSQLSRISFR